MAPPKIAPPPVPRLTWPGPVCPSIVTEANRIIGKHQIYDLDLVKELVRNHGVFVVNDDANDAMLGKGRNPLPAPAWSDVDVKNVILALDAERHFENSQWCKLTINRYLDCDSYAIYFSRAKGKEWNTPTSKGIKLYVKFGFFPNSTHSKAIVCRLHPAY